MDAIGAVSRAIHPDISVMSVITGHFGGLFYCLKTNERKELTMYALKNITTTPDGRRVEMVQALGDNYTLELKPNDAAPDVVARVHYNSGENRPCIEIVRSDEAYITTLTGDTVRGICRGEHKQREDLATTSR
ncbi:hypothetical protein ACX3SV_01045 [Hafnia paralvei]